MHEFPIYHWNGLNIDVSAFIAITVSVIATFLLVKLLTRKLSVANPSKAQNFMEWAVDFVHSTIASTMPLNRVRPFLGLGLTLILFIFVSNLLGLPFGIVTEIHHPGWGVAAETLAKHDGHAELAWWKSPTADLSVTSGLALIVFLLVHFLGMKMNAKHYFQHYFKPYPIFFPLNIIETIAKPVTLALRLFANIFAGEVLIATILMLGVIGTPFMIIWQGFSIFVGAIQAFLFTILTMVYISQAAIHDEDGAH
ncbi:MULTISPECIES: F0F1 ATP synthase subunit A [unclassified Paenibacillus]|uniref:F0F1 ATP synthase subunit A n=1 Tax=unclassified Paenibacillus TaxID=185978 RepID=UPI000953F5D7|nr:MULTISPECIES: F0F1 ATP synthase subunit A [unclassified Paenibacillus]ASS67286.1 F0F1 ATP synthase subunit A [Paenibacillus sp. RUD330]SIQ82678.1 F-type H+-transporting ATPase subunit a [Paenibacillus sp. RU4X]SIR04000.1 F-type H+-transporting ATPase subunit a [Paenibacillus sp. RU4T]